MATPDGREGGAGAGGGGGGCALARRYYYYNRTVGGRGGRVDGGVISPFVYTHKRARGACVRERVLRYNIRETFLLSFVIFLENPL